jgi:selenocysteine lyase/cysteine desulfurase
MPVDVQALGCHAYAASGHKWLLGPKGTGFLYIGKELSRALDALPIADGRSAGSNSTGIVNIGGLRGMGEAIDYVQALGPDRIARHNLELRSELHAQLSRFNQVHIPAPADGPLASANLAFSLPDQAELATLRRTLVTRHNVYIRTVEMAGFSGLRASMHAYNSSADVTRLVDALREELAG